MNRILAIHEIIPISVARDFLDRLSSMLRQNSVKAIPDSQDLTGMDIDIAGLSLKPTQRLMDHDPGMR